MSRLVQTIDIFTTRLRTLARLLDTAAMQWRAAGRDPEALVPLRLAADMLPLPYQIAFACNQPKDFVTFVLDGPSEPTDPMNPDPATLAFADLTALIEATITRLDAARQADPAVLLAAKRFAFRDGRYLDLPDGTVFVDDWLMPNFYFHVVTAYDILRHAGVAIGKPDYMAHVLPYLRGAAAAT